MDLKKAIKRDKEVLAETEGQVKDIRGQLSEQLRCLDSRMETQVALITEIQDYFRKRAEVEADYSRALDKLFKAVTLRHKEHRHKREQWHLFSLHTCWQQLLNSTKRAAKDHGCLSELYLAHTVPHFSVIMDDLQRVYRRCRETSCEAHDELMKVLFELHTATKTYHTYHLEFRSADSKLKTAEEQKRRVEQSIPPDKLQKNKKFRIVEKDMEKRKSKYKDARLKALKSRNEYTICMDVANASLHKYFVDDLSDITDCMDLGFYNSVSQVMTMHTSGVERVMSGMDEAIEGQKRTINDLDSRLDKKRFIESNNPPFMLPKRFNYQEKTDDSELLGAQKCLQEELETRYQQLSKRLTTLRAESEEIWKTLETAEKTLLEMVNSKETSIDIYFADDEKGRQLPEVSTVKSKSDRQETEDFYLTKFRQYTLENNLIVRLSAKQETLRRSLRDDQSNLDSLSPRPQRAFKPRRKRIGQAQLRGRTPRLFGGSLEEYLEATNEDIPLIIKSCIRVINLFGLHHQGIFRVSGSQVEINNFRDSFERGEDPLADMTDASDINSVAGVLKLYLRELREPLFPIIFFDQFMEMARLENRDDFISKMREVVGGMVRCVFVVLRYLFAFLNHLSEFSDENMMDPWNIAICIGPTLVPIPEDKDQVQYQNLVNELIKNIITYHEEIFPHGGSGTMYEKYISASPPGEVDVGEAPTEPITEDLDAEVCPSEDECEALECLAQFDYSARSGRELSFKKGDTLTLFHQVSGDWWKGSMKGKDGLIPDKYILLKIRDEDKDKDEGSRRRASSLSDSLKYLSVQSSSKCATSPCDSLSSLEESQAYEAEADRSDTVTLKVDDYSTEQPFHRQSSLRADSLYEVSEHQSHKRQTSWESCSVSDSQGLTAKNLWGKRASSQSSLSFQENVDTRQSSIDTKSESPETRGFQGNREFWEQQTKMKQKQTPDLVMDLPLIPIGSKEKSEDVRRMKRHSSSSESIESDVCAAPESPDMTAAERFAKSNQCTLKKNSAGQIARHSQSSDAETQTASCQASDVKSEVVPIRSPRPTTPKSATKFPHLSTSCSAGPISSFKPKVKPPVLKKPVLPQKPSPELGRKCDDTP